MRIEDLASQLAQARAPSASHSTQMHATTPAPSPARRSLPASDSESALLVAAEPSLAQHSADSAAQEDHATLKEEKEQLCHELVDAQAQLEGLRRELAAALEGRRSADAGAASAAGQLAASRAECQRMQEELEAMSAAVQCLQADNLQLVERGERLRGTNGTLAAAASGLRADLEESLEMQAGLADSVAQLREDGEWLAARKAELEGDLANAHVEAAAAQERLEVLEAEAAAAERARIALHGSLEACQAELAAREEECAAARAAAERARGAAADAESSRAELEQQVALVSADKDRLQSELQDTLNSLHESQSSAAGSAAVLSAAREVQGDAVPMATGTARLRAERDAALAASHVAQARGVKLEEQVVALRGELARSKHAVTTVVQQCDGCRRAEKATAAAMETAQQAVHESGKQCKQMRVRAQEAAARAEVSEVAAQHLRQQLCTLQRALAAADQQGGTDGSTPYLAPCVSTDSVAHSPSGPIAALYAQAALQSAPATVHAYVSPRGASQARHTRKALTKQVAHLTMQLAEEQSAHQALCAQHEQTVQLVHQQDQLLRAAAGECATLIRRLRRTTRYAAQAPPRSARSGAHSPASQTQPQPQRALMPLHGADTLDDAPADFAPLAGAVPPRPAAELPVGTMHAAVSATEAQLREGVRALRAEVRSCVHSVKRVAGQRDEMEAEAGKLRTLVRFCLQCLSMVTACRTGSCGHLSRRSGMCVPAFVQCPPHSAHLVLVACEAHMLSSLPHCRTHHRVSGHILCLNVGASQMHEQAEQLALARHAVCQRQRHDARQRTELTEARAQLAGALAALADAGGPCRRCNRGNPCEPGESGGTGGEESAGEPTHTVVRSCSGTMLWSVPLLGHRRLPTVRSLNFDGTACWPVRAQTAVVVPCCSYVSSMPCLHRYCRWRHHTLSTWHRRVAAPAAVRASHSRCRRPPTHGQRISWSHLRRLQATTAETTASARCAAWLRCSCLGLAPAWAQAAARGRSAGRRRPRNRCRHCPCREPHPWHSLSGCRRQAGRLWLARSANNGERNCVRRACAERPGNNVTRPVAHVSLAHACGATRRLVRDDGGEGTEYVGAMHASCPMMCKWLSHAQHPGCLWFVAVESF